MPFSSSATDAKIQAKMSWKFAVALLHKLQRLKVEINLLNILRNLKSSVFPRIFVNICFLGGENICVYPLRGSKAKF